MTEAEPGRRPNIVFIVADQLRADAVGAFGSPVASTPNLDALAGQGTRFTNAFVQHTVCSPSRVSFLTGWYPHVRGHRSLTHLLRPEDPNLLRSCREAGYHVTHVGRRGDTFAPGATEASCDEYGWVDPPTVSPHGLMADLDRDDPMVRAFHLGRLDAPLDDFDEACVRTAERWLSDRALDRASDQPWFLYVPLLFPHCPFAVDDPWFSLHDRSAMPVRRPPVTTGHEPSFMARLRADYGTDRLADAQWREIAAVYHGMVSRLDWHVGRLLAALGPDRLEDTVLVFCSDHGEYLGDYGLIEKWPSGLNDCLARNPLILAGPGIPSGAVRDHLVELIDLVPTIQELAGVSPGHTHFGRSLLPMLADPAVGHRELAFTEGGFLRSEADLLETAGFPYDRKAGAQRSHPETVGKAVAVRSAEWTYVWRLYEPPELYDRRADPDEIHNVAGQASTAAVESDLRDALLRWMVETGDVLPWAPDPRFPRIDLPTPG
ncbi:MAG: sulfatase-like hydrolase/transferase [Actinomycetota bacterium]